MESVRLQVQSYHGQRNRPGWIHGQTGRQARRPQAMTSRWIVVRFHSLAHRVRNRCIRSPHHASASCLGINGELLMLVLEVCYKFEQFSGVGVYRLNIDHLKTCRPRIFVTNLHKPIIRLIW